MRKDDPLEMAKYAYDHQLTDIQGWKWAKKYKRSAKRFIRTMARVRSAQTSSGQGRNKFKFGIQVPASVYHSEQLDKEAGNTMWSDAIKKKLAKINKYNVFKPLPIGTKPPHGYKKMSLMSSLF